MLVQYMERGPGAGPGDEAGAWPLPGRTRIRPLEQGLHRAERVGQLKTLGIVPCRHCRAGYFYEVTASPYFTSVTGIRN
jgi:hypothetical protein